MKELNILISSVGRQSFLVNVFQKSLSGRGRVVVTDFNKESAAFSIADKSYDAPAYSDPNYMDWLVKLCYSENIKLLFSLNVDELVLLETNRFRFEEIDCHLVGGPLDSIKMSLDKLEVMHFCQEHDLPVIETRLATDSKIHELKFPVIAKPRFGKGSRGMKKLFSETELYDFLIATESLDEKNAFVYQEIMKGDEYGFDLINDLNRNYAGILVRKKISMKNGETEEAITMEEKPWIEFARKVTGAVSHEGLIDVDAIIVDNQPYVMDINFRFGGGYVFSHLAGADVPRAYVAWMIGEEVKSHWLKSKTGISNCRSRFQKNQSSS